MKKLLWTSAIALTAAACMTACDDSSSGASNSIPEFKTEAALPDTCEMEVAKAGDTYFACFENKWIEVTDSATVEQFKEGLDEDEVKAKLEELEDLLKPTTPAKPKSSSSKKTDEDVESSDSEEPESSASEEECTGRRCKTGNSSSSKKSSGGSGSGEGGSGSGEGGSGEGGDSSPSSTDSSGDSSPSSATSGTSTESASSGTSTESKCGGETYDPDLFTCTSNKIAFKDMTMSASSTKLPSGGSINLTVPGKTKCKYIAYGTDGKELSDYLYSDWSYTTTTEEDCLLAMPHVNSTASSISATVGLRSITIDKKNYVVLHIKGGSATPAPPIGPALGAFGANIVSFATEFNTRTKGEEDKLFSVLVTIKADKSFSFVTNFADIPSVNVTIDKDKCYGVDLSSTQICDSRDGKVYKTVEIGTQTWMAENLNYETASGSYCYDDDPENCETYGRLYDWDIAVSTTSPVCPTGWRIPSLQEYKDLIVFVDDDLTTYSTNNKAAIALRSTTSWDGGSATNASGFNLLMAGNRNSSGSYKRSSTQVLASDDKYSYLLVNNTSDIAWANIYTSEVIARSVRCIKDTAGED